jgi:hypothetical protein
MRMLKRRLILTNFIFCLKKKKTELERFNFRFVSTVVHGVNDNRNPIHTRTRRHAVSSDIAYTLSDFIGCIYTADKIMKDRRNSDGNPRSRCGYTRVLERYTHDRRLRYDYYYCCCCCCEFHTYIV